MYEDIIERVAARVLGSKTHMEETAEIAEKACKVEGDMCECGCYCGGTSAIMGYICRKHDKDIKIHLYDSFEGIPYPTEEDLEIPGWPEGVTRTGELKSTGISVANMETLNLMLFASGYKITNYVVNVGWLQNTLPATLDNIKELCFLRVDVDLYVPTKLSLELLYNKVVEGGYTLVHDYDSLSGCRQAVDEFLETHPEIELTHCRDAGGVYWKKNSK